MASIEMRVMSVGGDADRLVAQLQAVPDPEDELANGGNATLILFGDDAKDSELEVGAIVEISVSVVSTAADDPGIAAVAAARAIPNSTNTLNYKTPASAKVPPPVVPDGVVTLPRPSVVMEPLSDTPPDAGVTSPAPTPTKVGVTVTPTHTSAAKP